MARDQNLLAGYFRLVAVVVGVLDARHPMDKDIGLWDIHIYIPGISSVRLLIPLSSVA
jgi:hypothetical protein